MSNASVVGQVSIPLEFASGIDAVVIVSVLPRDEKRDLHLLHYLESTPPVGTAAIQLLEASEYRYEVRVEDTLSVTTNRPEIFQADKKDGRTGRIRTGLYTGLLPIHFTVSGENSRDVEFEVRSRKLDYLTDYRWMLRDLSDELTEIVLSAFGPTEQKLETAQNRDAVTLYHRFCFLRGLIETERFQDSLLRILTSPYRSWESEEFERDAGAGVRASSSIARQIARPGIRRTAPSTKFGSLPTRLHIERSEETVDNVPNRFVKYALMRWRAEVQHIAAALEEEDDSAPVSRGLDEVRAVLERLDEILAEPLFREVGNLGQSIGANQVLQRKEGYREILVAFLQSELASQLAWEGGDDVFGAGKRDVAALYEYWVFLKLAQMVSAICDIPLNFAALFAPTNNGLRLTLRRRNEAILRGTLHRLGRTIDVEFYFNKTFAAGRESWSREMRPDYSIILTPQGTSDSWLTPVIIHFDAKYRVENIKEVFGPREAGDKESDVKRNDLLKMHAYKDAIKRSSGAYVLYPGESDDALPEYYHELLPGIGAFCLRPSEDGEGTGTPEVKDFLNRMVTHLATQLTEDERDRFWHNKVRTEGASGIEMPSAAFLKEPPLDALVLIAPVRGVEEYRWVVANQIYPIPTDDDSGSLALAGYELGANLLMLYDDSAEYAALYRISGPPRISSGNSGLMNSYPRRPEALYVLIPIQPIADEFWNSRIKVADVRNILPNPIRPVARTWALIVEEFYRMGLKL